MPWTILSDQDLPEAAARDLAVGFYAMGFTQWIYRYQLSVKARINHWQFSQFFKPIGHLFAPGDHITFISPCQTATLWVTSDEPFQIQTLLMGSADNKGE